MHAWWFEAKEESSLRNPNHSVVAIVSTALHSICLQYVFDFSNKIKFIYVLYGIGWYDTIDQYSISVNLKLQPTSRRFDL